MLARGLIIAFILETVLISAVLYWVGDVRLGDALIYAMAIIVFLRLGIAWLSFAVAVVFRAKPPAGFSIRLTPFLRMIGRESVAVLRLFFALHPLAPWLDQPDPDDEEVQGPPVLLVHGFFSNAGFWWEIKRWLRSRGVNNLYTITLEPAFGDIERMADRLDDRIREVLIRSSTDKLVLVGHSMGGLVARAYLARHGGERVQRLITLGSPHSGTVLAWLLPGRNLAQMRPDNRWLIRLNDSQRGGLPAPTASIYSYQDNIVVPQDSPQLMSASNIPIAGVGHLEMAFSPLIKELLLKQIMAASAF